MTLAEEWVDRRALVQASRVWLELFPANHSPRWVATSEAVPGTMTSSSLYSASGTTEQARCLLLRWTSEDPASMAAD